MATVRRATGYDNDGEDNGGGRQRQRGRWRQCDGRRRNGRRDTMTTAKTMAVDDEDNEVDDDGVNDPRSRREGKHKKNTSLKKAPLSPQVHAADIPQDSRTHMDKKAKIS